MSQIGIYKITSPTGKVYIGQSINIKERKGSYRRLECKKQIKLYNSLVKYGWNKHKFDIIHECTRQELNDLEIYYIDLYQSFNSEHGLNLRTGGMVNTSCSKETKEKIRKFHLGSVRPSTWKPILKYNKQGKFLEEYKSITEAIKLNNISKSNIQQCLSKNSLTAGNFIWLYKINDKIQLTIKHRIREKNKPILQYDINGKFIREYVSRNVAAISNDICPYQISQVINSVTRKAGGYFWRYKTNNFIEKTIVIQKVVYPNKWKAVSQYDKNDILINEFSSIKDASLQTKISRHSLQQCLSGNNKTARGYKWKYKNKPENQANMHKVRIKLNIA